jgi:hypothetical protein
MRAREKQPDGFTTVDTGNEQWAYTQEFNDLKHKKPHALEIVMDLINKVDSKRKRGSSAEKDDIQVNLVALKEALPRQRDTIHYYRIVAKVEGQAYEFFLKKTPIAYKQFGGGEHEAASSHKAREILRENNIKDVEVVNFQMGFSDGKNWYFVSKYNKSLESPLDYYKELLSGYIKLNPNSSDSERQELEYINKRVEDLQKLLPNFSDLFAHNMYYNASDRKIILFDLFEGPLETVKVD